MFVIDALDVPEAEALCVELAEELLGDVLDIEGGFEAVGDFDDGDVAFGVESLRSKTIRRACPGTGRPAGP